MTILADTSIPGWSSGNELGLLGALASLTPKNGIIVELGSFAGRTAFIMAQNAPSAKIYCIDPWLDFDFASIPADSLAWMEGHVQSFRSVGFYEYFLENIKECHNIVPIREYSQKAHWKTEDRIDLAFVDADHDADPLFQDMTIWWPRLTADGLMVGHDWPMKTVKDGIMRFLDWCWSREEYPQLINFPTTSIWGLLKGVAHAKKWGMDFSALYPYGDGNWTRPRAPHCGKPM